MAESRSLSEATEANWQRWRELVREQGLDVPADKDFGAELLRVWEASDYVTRSCLCHPRLLLDLWSRGDLQLAYPAGAVAQRLRSRIESVADQKALEIELRRFRREQMVRIIWRDLSGRAPLREVLEDLTALADACIEQAVDLLYAWHCTELGTPRSAAGEPQPLVVLGMGKLGGRELNLSSDIDLIFAYPEHGQSDGPRPLDNEQFFTRLCRALVQVLDSKQAEGFVFRVDTRLRPYGSAGPLAMSFEAMEDYYQFQAREWERYAMIKARVVVGDGTAGKVLQEMLRPFVYRRYLDFGAIEALRDMKDLISRELSRKGMADNIKLGPGGIREIEFIGQAYQLVRGGRDPDLQIRPIVPVLERLGAKGQLPDYAARDLVSAYDFLRRLENRLQAWMDQQTHVLPEDPISRLRLARSMGFSAWKGLSEQLGHHRRRVQGHFDRVFASPQADQDSSEGGLGGVWLEHGDDAADVAALADAGFADAPEALRMVKGFRSSRACRSLSKRGRERLDQLMPLVLDAVASVEMPGAPLQRVLRLLEAVVQRTAYIALLAENPIALSQLVRLSAVSPWIARLLTRYPLLLDELLDPRRLYAPLHRDRLTAELDSLLASVGPEDLEQQMERLRQFAYSNVLRVASADITGAIPLMVVSDFLTEIAETVLERVVDLAWRHMSDRHGRPQGLADDATGFAVVAYGKLGGIELGYGSDLDLVYLHGNEQRGTRTDGERPLSAEQFYARMGQRIIHILTTQTPSGVLYEADMRLRPNGASGMLVSSLDAFQTYQLEDAWTWEHQALTRARAVAGDPRVRARFEEIRRQVLTRPRDAERLREEVRQMRERMRRELARREQDRFDLKQAEGGIADIEFVVQYSVLRWAHEYPDLLDFSDNIRMLDGLARHHLLEGDEAQRLADAYRTFRAAYHRNTLQDQPGLVDGRCCAQEREAVVEIWRRLMGGDG